MGVYIKGMEMPKNCLECEIRSYDANAQEEYCPFSEIVCLSIGIQDNCPLVEVPEPHGRLVDADKLIMHLADYQLQESPVWGSNEYGNADKYEAITDCIDAVESACAVIEAEGEYKCE